LRHCATNRKVAGSIPDAVTGFFHGHNSSGRTMALGSSQPLSEMITRNISWGKGGRCEGLTTLPPSCADYVKIWEPQPPGTLMACQFWYPRSRVRTRPKPSDFYGENNHSMPSFGGEVRVKPSVPCRRLAACQRTL
jgi:hypothetical protein